MERCEFRLLTPEELSEMYELHMRRDFPPSELKPLQYLLRLMEAGNYQPYALFRDRKLISYAFYWSAGDPYVMLDYFAVVPEERNQGIGGALLREMLDRFCVGGQGIFGEVELPEAAEGDVRSLRLRRVGFYLRAGMEKRGFCTHVFDVPYQVLSYGPAISDEALMEVNRRIYRSVLSEEDYARRICIPWRLEETRS